MGKMSMRQYVPGTRVPWGEMSQGRDVHRCDFHGEDVSGMSVSEARCP
jgi:hypothetical protein